MRKRNLFITAFLCILTLSIQAQENYYGKIVDNKQQPISFANVALLNANDSSFVTGVTTDEDGKFNLLNVSKGLLKISRIGYNDQIINAKPNTSLSVILSSAITNLEGVEVALRRPITRIEGDALVTSIKGTILENVGNANDVLGHLPGIITTAKGIAVFGKGKPLVYINGRKVNNDNLLEQLKSNKIKKVEVVMNPGARYNATVNAVIRITAERAPGEGLAFDSTTKLSYCDYLNGSEIINANYRRDKLDIFADLEYSRKKTKGSSNNLQNTWLASQYTQNVDMSQKETSKLYDSRLGFNYTISPVHAFGLFYKVSHKPTDFCSLYNTQSRINNILNDENNVVDYNNAKITTHNIDAYYTNQIGKWTLNTTFDVLWKYAKGNENINETHLNISNRTITSTDKISSRMLAGELHLSHPFLKGQINLGTEISDSHRDENFVNIENVLPSNNPLIKEMNTAVYLEMMQRLGKIGFQIGVRYEHINNNYYENKQKIEEQSRVYNKLFPTIMMMVPINRGMVQLSYTKKYNRPLYSQLGGGVSYVNKYLYQSGNPNLRPSYVDNISCNIQYSWAMLMLNYAHTTDKIITSALDYGNGNATLFKNMNSEYKMTELQLGLQVSPQFKRYYPALMVGMFVPFYKEMYKGETKSFNRVMGIVKFNNIISLTPTCMLNADLSWRSKGNAENMDMAQTWQINAGLMKQLGKNWKMKLMINDIFNSARKNCFTLYSGVREIEMAKFFNTRSIECTLTYSFNTIKSKYKGKGAGNNEKDRL